jgi:hypothetical protein
MITALSSPRLLGVEIEDMRSSEKVRAIALVF